MKRGRWACGENNLPAEAFGNTGLTPFIVDPSNDNKIYNFIRGFVEKERRRNPWQKNNEYVSWFVSIPSADVAKVGGKK
jgi:hypothetical protein